jgi:leader peptidase (prepilin peptidase)/N-methyltransferase
VIVVAGSVLGLLVGSYLAVVVDRLAIGATSTLGRSHCDSCGRRLQWAEMIPVASYVALRGRCRTCGAAVPVWSLASEIATGVLFGAMAWRFGWQWELGGYLVLMAALVVLAIADQRLHRLPRRIIHLAAIGGVPFLVAAALIDDDAVRLQWSALGGLGALAIFLLLHVGWRGSIGDGDVRLAALLGVFLGWLGPMHVPVGLFFGFLTAALVALPLLATGRVARTTRLVFGPFMAAGAVIAILWGRTLIPLWLGD